MGLFSQGKLAERPAEEKGIEKPPGCLGGAGQKSG
jgi:hypothetical protein